MWSATSDRSEGAEGSGRKSSRNACALKAWAQFGHAMGTQWAQIENGLGDHHLTR